MAAESTITRALAREDPLARRRRLRYLVQRILIYTLLVLGAVIILVPFLWMISTSLKVEAHLFDQPPQWIPKPIAPENYVDAWKKLASIAPGLTFWRIMGNTLFITGLAMFAEMFPAQIRLSGVSIAYAIGAVFGGAGSQALFGSAGPVDFIKKATLVMVVVFMLTSLTLGFFNLERPSKSVMSTAPAATQTVPGAPAGQAAPPAAAPSAPAAPVQPAAPAAPATPAD